MEVVNTNTVSDKKSARGVNPENFGGYKWSGKSEELCGPTYFVNFGLQFTGVQCDEQLSLEEVGQLVLRDLGDGVLPGRCLHRLVPYVHV